MNKASITPEDIEKYSNPIPNREYILDLLDEHDEQLTRAQIAKALNLTDDEQKEALRRRLRAMERDGQVLFDTDKTYRVLDDEDFLEGRVIGHRDGFGFLSCDSGGDDLYLHNSQMRKVFDGDRVRVLIRGVDRRGREEASIVEVIERNTKMLVGRLQQEGDAFTLQPENTRVMNVIEIAKDQLAGATDGQYVVAEIFEYPTHNANAKAKVSEVLGESMAPGMEIDVAIRSHHLPHLWPQGTVQAAEAMGSEVAEADKLNRVDLRTMPFVTIDGEDAQDFDDAVYSEPTKGGWRLFVAIADVSHYVQPDSPLDKEAQVRATSVYFPGQVIPMLPEALSNGLCSLNPHVDRLVMVCEMVLNSAGKMTSYEFYEGVIHSKARLTYNEVNAFLTAPQSELGAKVQQKHGAVVPHLTNLHKLYDVLRQARSRRGSIDFDTHEVKFQFSKDRKIEKILPVVRNDAHMLIEECMLCANVATARFLEKLKIPALYRVHAGPQAKKLEVLRAFLTGKGLKLAGGAKPTPGHYDQILSSVSARSDASVIQTMMLRSLSKAEYSPDNLGHFGLAYDAYAHFTSPIRRYPDLLVHRAIRSVIRKPEGGGLFGRLLKTVGLPGGDPVRRVPGAKPLDPAISYPYDMAAMLILAEHCSMASRRADKASWDVEAWLKCEYMKDCIGDVFEGTISSVTHFGLFIELKETQVEGLVHITALTNDYYQFDPVRQCLVGDRTNNEYGLGDDIKVRVVSVDMDQRKIEFDLMQPAPAKKKSRRRPKRKD